MAKEQETKLMYDLYQALPQDSYLKDLLKGLPEYCEVQIGNDWAINPLETIDSLRAAAEEAVSKIKKFDEIEADYVKTLTNKEERIAQLEERRNNDRRQYVELQDQLEATKAEAKEQRLRAAGAEMEVQELTAKLYDYMVGNKK